MNEPSGAGYAACAWRVPVLPTVVSKQFSGVRALGVEDHDVSAGHERQDRVRVLVVEQDHVRAHGVSAGRGPAQIRGGRAQVEAGDRPRVRGMLAHQARTLVDQELAAEAGAGVGLVGDPDLEAALAWPRVNGLRSVLCGEAGNRRGRPRPDDESDGHERAAGGAKGADCHECSPDQLTRKPAPDIVNGRQMQPGRETRHVDFGWDATLL